MKLFKRTFVVFLLTTIVGYAQTEKGRFYIEANSSINFSSTKTKYIGSNSSEGTDDKVTNLSITPSAGYFFIDNMVIGLSAPLIFSNIGEDYGQSFSFILAPYIKYYFLHNKFRPFAKVQYGLGQTIYKNALNAIIFIDPNDSNSFDPNDYPGPKDKIHNLRQFMGTIGLSYFFNSNFGLEFNLNYSFEKNTLKNELSSYNYYSDYYLESEETSGITSSIGFVILI